MFRGRIICKGDLNFFSHGLLAYLIKNNSELLPILLKVIETRIDKYYVSVKDDYIIQHHLWSDLRSLNYLRNLNKRNLLYEDVKNIKPYKNKRIKIDYFLQKSGHIFITHGNLKTHVSIMMGGLFRSYRNNKFLTQETQNIIKIKNLFTYALNKDISWEWIVENHLIIKGNLCRYKKAKMNTMLITLRLIMIFR